ncbi:hypothetical protein B9Z55_004371 [Caenorhabditis nigoni]|uniref:RING-type domain-containing protein n=1 Tax=Caenorhabditis nigoni TaxID=1611254 RepID=A0A2G5UW27_9PELO|nr:hypothetical protein B9Z55_004371 [Caenorhabditis nigoni]
MSKFLEIPNCALTPMGLHKEALNYSLNAFRETLRYIDSLEYPQRNLKGKEKEFSQFLIDKSNGMLRMYGSAEDLLENVKIYKSFPEHHNCFGSSNEPYQTRPNIYKSLKNENYIAKSDVFVFLQNMILTLFLETSGEECPPSLVFLFAFYLKSRQESMEKCVEYVKFDEKIFEELNNKIIEKVRSAQFSSAKHQELVGEFSKLTLPQIIEKFKRLIPSTLTPNQELILTLHFGNFITGLPARERNEGIAMSYSVASKTLKSLEAVIDENLEMFSPRRQDSKQPITVRVFEDGDQRFVMEEEFKKSIHEKCEGVNDTLIRNTISMENVRSKYKQKIADIEFIRYPITRAKHRATPIQGPSGHTYIPAVDLFFEMMREVILGMRIFQRIKPVHLPMFVQDFNEFSKILYETESPYFIQNDKNIMFAMRIISDSPAKDVRNAKSDGFTVQNLKNELAHLGLTAIFPEIQNYVEKVYSEVDKRKKSDVLRTCDLFDAIEQCQLNCILEILPKLKKFVHSQKGCHRVYGWKCEECAAETPENQDDQKLSILEKELEELKIAHQKILDENQQKSLEIQELQQKNLRLSVKNETNEFKLKQLTDKLAQSKLSIDEGNYSNACTSQLKIQCLICEKSIESGKDQIIRCPLCKRRFHSKCANNWLKEHTECPACNGDLPKF